ncbi:50S ribosomal protein L21e [Candidatus Woesearchaeota archaeon]|nr:MAG: 50S ribosomal protein L21e [Candidatus Woesearchaeota archaeon]
MAMRIGGSRRKTRHKLLKPHNRKGKISITKYLQKFSEGDKVQLLAEPAVQKGMYFPRYHGKSGVVVGKQGECYKVMIKDSGKEKVMIVHPVHLKALSVKNS